MCRKSNYASIGIDVASEAHAKLSDNFSLYEISEETIASMCEDRRSQAQAIAIICTNMRGPLIAATLKRRLGIPILDSIAFPLWGCLWATGVLPLFELGSMFTKRQKPDKVTVTTGRRSREDLTCRG